jgi:hypothetical protein
MLSTLGNLGVEYHGMVHEDISILTNLYLFAPQAIDCVENLIKSFLCFEILVITDCGMLFCKILCLINLDHRDFKKQGWACAEMVHVNNAV